MIDYAKYCRTGVIYLQGLRREFSNEPLHGGIDAPLAIPSGGMRKQWDTHQSTASKRNDGFLPAQGILVRS